MGRKKLQYTCRALEACEEDELIDIFEENFGYLSFVSKFVQRRINDPLLYQNNPISQCAKPLLILDIDNTILFVRFFSDEICVDDNIKYFIENEAMDGVVSAVWYRLKLTLSDDDIIDDLGTDMIEFDHCHIQIHRLKKKQSFQYPYKIDERSGEIQETRSSIIKDFQIIGCEIEYYDHLQSENASVTKYVSFEDQAESGTSLQSQQSLKPGNHNTNTNTNDDTLSVNSFMSNMSTVSTGDLANFQPCLERDGMQAVSFIHDGFLVRIRPGMEDFIEHANEDWDVCFFTAANRNIYQGLMRELHSFLMDILAMDIDTDGRLWNEAIFFRDDCTFDYDDRGKIYHHKDITKFGKDLSKVVMVDNSSLAFKSLEPNSILIKDYFGKLKDETSDTGTDMELEIVSEMLDTIIDDYFTESEDKFIDFRYILCDINPMPSDLHVYQHSESDDILESTKRFLNDLRIHLQSEERLSSALRFDEPPKSMFSDDDSSSVFHTDVDLDSDLESMMNLTGHELDTDVDTENDEDITQKSNHIHIEPQENQLLSNSETGDIGNSPLAVIDADEQYSEIEELKNYVANKKRLESAKQSETESKPHPRHSTYNISISVGQLQQLNQNKNRGSNASPLDADEQQALAAIMHSPLMSLKLQTMTERELMQFADDGEFEMDDHGIGSKEEEDEDPPEHSDPLPASVSLSDSAALKPDAVIADDANDNAHNPQNNSDEIENTFTDTVIDMKSKTMSTPKQKSVPTKPLPSMTLLSPNDNHYNNSSRDSSEEKVDRSPSQTPNVLLGIPGTGKKFKSPNTHRNNAKHLNQTEDNVRKRFSMRPKPDQQTMTSGMTSKFLKRSINQYVQIHESKQEESRRNLTSQPKQISHQNKRAFKFNLLRAQFEAEINVQTHSQQRSLIHGKSALQELDIEEEKSYNTPKLANYNNKALPTKAKPSKLQYKRIDNPWIAKMKKSKHSSNNNGGTKHSGRPHNPRRLAKMMRTITDETPKPVSARALPPSPVMNRPLPEKPAQTFTQMSSLALSAKSNNNNNNTNTNSNSNADPDNDHTSNDQKITHASILTYMADEQCTTHERSKILWKIYCNKQLQCLLLEAWNEVREWNENERTVILDSLCQRWQLYL